MKRKRIYLWRYLNRNALPNIMKKYKNRKDDYYTCYLFDDYEDMYKYVNKIEKNDISKDYAGRTLSYKSQFYDEFDNPLHIYGPDCGKIYLCKKNLGDRTISHEASHAVIGYFSRFIEEKNDIYITLDKNGNIINSPNIEIEELFCYMVGEMTNQIVNFYVSVVEKENK